MSEMQTLMNNFYANAVGINMTTLWVEESFLASAEGILLKNCMVEGNTDSLESQQNDGVDLNGKGRESDDNDDV